LAFVNICGCACGFGTEEEAVTAKKDVSKKQNSRANSNDNLLCNNIYLHPI